MNHRHHMRSLAICLGAALFVLLLALLKASVVYASTTWYVAPTGDDTNDCLAVSSACRTIGATIEKAAADGTVGIASGTYTENVQIGKNLTMTSISTLPTAIDGGRVESVVRITSITASVTISGLTIQNGRALGGGGIENVNGGRLTLINSTVQNNRTILGGGGGILSYGPLQLINSTVSGNEATTTGGAIWIEFATLTLHNSTITDNEAHGEFDGPVSTGGIYATGYQVDLQNTIIAGNRSSGGSKPTVHSPDCVGVLFLSQGYNLIGNNTECRVLAEVGDQIGTGDLPIDPRLGPLQNNGGATPTHALLVGSSAIDRGNPATPGSSERACLTHDQRGTTRPVDGTADGVERCDVGAYEAEELSPLSYLPLVWR